MSLSLLILGGTSRTGRQLVLQALQQGYRVTVMSRQPQHAQGLPDHSQLELVKGDVLSYVDVFNGVQGNDVVISAFDAECKNEKVFTVGTENILRAIRQSSIQRFICLSSLGAGSTKSLIGWHTRLLYWLTGQQPIVEAKGLQELMLYKSTCSFTLVMTGTIVDDHQYSRWYVSAPEPSTTLGAFLPKIDRQAVSKFLLELLFDTPAQRKTICLLSCED
jgi:nucleoside-diphosphate-sugar epimerase